MTDKKPTSFRPDLFAAEIKKAAGSKGLPPVHLWNPDFCGDIDMQIKRDGSWHYMGSPIARPAMVRLFSTILRHDEDGKYYLVTPVEKVGIRVDDAPFVAVEMRVEGEGTHQTLHFRTNVDDITVANKNHPLHIIYDGGGASCASGGGSSRSVSDGSPTHKTNEKEGASCASGGGSSRSVSDGSPTHQKNKDTSPSPYILVRDRLEALISRPVYYQLAELAVEKDGQYGVWSAGCFFALGPVE